MSRGKALMKTRETARWKKPATVLLAGVFLYSSVMAPAAEADFWSERRRAAARHNPASAGAPDLFPQFARALRDAPPASAGLTALPENASAASIPFLSLSQ